MTTFRKWREPYQPAFVPAKVCCPLSAAQQYSGQWQAGALEWGLGNIVQNEPRKSPPADAGSSLPLTPSPAYPDLPNVADTGQASPGLSDDAAASPAWAKDLRILYNSVVEEQLPDSFIALLAQLDSED